MTCEELEYIQTFCHQWLREPGASHASRRTIPAGGPLSHPVELEISGLLTFDNVLIKSAIDLKTGTCYFVVGASPLRRTSDRQISRE